MGIIPREGMDLAAGTDYRKRIGNVAMQHLTHVHEA